MNTIIIKKIRVIIGSYGIDICKDIPRFKNILSDYLQNYKLERNLIIFALESGLVEELINTSQTSPSKVVYKVFRPKKKLQNNQFINEVIFPKYIKQLTKDYGITQENAEWAINAWCQALNIETQRVEQPITHFLKPKLQWIKRVFHFLNNSMKPLMIKTLCILWFLSIPFYFLFASFIALKNLKYTFTLFTYQLNIMNGSLGTLFLLKLFYFYHSFRGSMLFLQEQSFMREITPNTEKRLNRSVVIGILLTILIWFFEDNVNFLPPLYSYNLLPDYVRASAWGVFIFLTKLLNPIDKYYKYRR